MKTLAAFRGQWIVRYNSGQFSGPEIWDAVADINQWLADRGWNPECVEAVIDKDLAGNHLHIDDQGLNKPSGVQLSLCSLQIGDFSTIDRKISFDSIQLPGTINRVYLAIPQLMSDTRWRSISHTSSSLFLGSTLANHAFDVTAGSLVLPAVKPDPRMFSADFLGFTLFEDMFLEFKDFIDKYSENQQNPKAVLAAGGPLITLHPLAAAYHLPNLNLLVRGESELILPRILWSLNHNHIQELLRIRGFIWQQPGLLLISGLNLIHRPQDFQGFSFNLDFLEKEPLYQGLELNLSRGCSRTCLFCCRIQGNKVRKLPVQLADDLFRQYLSTLHTFDIQSSHSSTVNINDDDLLQDQEYARQIFKLLTNRKLRLWGIQSSIASFYDSRGNPNIDTLNLAGRKELFVGERPILWLGTDTFIQVRGKRLGKRIPTESDLLKLLDEFEAREIDNYHYWISSDHLSTWQEIAQEFMLIVNLHRKYSYFHLLAHAPFVVPYSTTAVYRLLAKSEKHFRQIKYKKVLPGRKDYFQLPLVDRVVTPFEQLNNLLDNQNLEGEQGFFTAIRNGNFKQALITMFNFLKRERLVLEASGGAAQVEQLRELEGNLSEFIGVQFQ